MKLTIQRNQAAKTGFFGGHKGMRFSLVCRVALNPEEHQLIERYKAGEQVLAILERKDRPEIITIGSLVAGYSEEHDSVVNLLKNEEEIKNVCSNFKSLLLVMKSFGGEEVIEF
jgi:hypothetical protein